MTLDRMPLDKMTLHKMTLVRLTLCPNEEIFLYAFCRGKFNKECFHLMTGVAQKENYGSGPIQLCQLYTS
jgi:hypothetical protein